MSRLDGLAPALLLVMTARHYAWLAATSEHRGEASKALGALAALALLGIGARLYRSANQAPARVLLAVAMLYAWHEVQTALCAIWFIFAPWVIAPGQAMCSAAIGFDLGALGIVGVAAIAWHMTHQTNKVSG